MRLRSLLLLISFAVLLGACSDTPSSLIDAEPALGVMGGAIMGTQGTGLLAQRRQEKLRRFENFLQSMTPVQEAFAALRSLNACADMTTASVASGGVSQCVGAELQLFMNNCQPSGILRSGLRRGYISYTFPTAPDCANALAAGFDGTTLAGINNQTIVRDWGTGPAGDQNNIRVGQDLMVNYVYGAYPSGWQEDRTGGVSISFSGTAGENRRIVVNGVHAIGIMHNSTPVPNTTTFDLATLATIGGTLSRKYDHTIHTIKTGDSLFAVGPLLDFDGTTASFGTIAADTLADFDGDIVMTGNTVAVGAAMRVQHNLSESIGVLVVTEPLVYNDPLCCWPNSGKIEVQYDRNLRSPTLEETVVFTGESCGAILYTTSLIENEQRTLNSCF